MGCNVVLVEPSEESGGSEQGFGYFSTAIYDNDSGDFLGCVDFSNYWKEQSSDAAFKLSRAFAALLGVFITTATFVCLLVQCFTRHGKSCLWSLMKWAYMGAFLCQGGSFVIRSTDLCDAFEGKESSCSLGSDGIAAICNCALLFGMVIATFNSSPPRNPVFRCWHSTDDDCETDSENSKAEIPGDEEGEQDVESQVKSVAQASHRSSQSVRSAKHSRGGDNSPDDCSVSLFSSKSWLSNPQKLSVKQHARRFEKKGNLWPMNQLNPQWPTREYEGAPKKFVPAPENTAVEPYRTSNLAVPKAATKNTTNPGIDTKSGLPKTGLVPASVGAAYLTQIRARQQANGITETVVVATKKSEKQEQDITKTSSTSSNIKRTSLTSKTSKENGEVPKVRSFEEAHLGKTLEQLCKSVTLQNGGTRIEETLVGSTVKIVDEYPNTSESSKSDKGNSTKMVTGAGVVTVRTEDCAEGRKTVMEETRQDGSRVVTTLIDPLTIVKELGGMV